ncbi:unnamed protein product [Schistosoma margrebowiei]|uniref:Uncharacterized protein n=1 Tax=Schistosoma margrebowiei TaxID=48269 RepID=A0A183N4L3_9TREM|nr:unnamed protein product [Schistosoma margrebowiei]
MFQALQDLLWKEEITMGNKWKDIKEALTSTRQEVLDYKKHHHKELTYMETLEKIRERKNKKIALNSGQTRTEKAKAQAEYTEANKQVRKRISGGKKYMEELATTAEEASREGNMKKIIGHNEETDRGI